MKARKLVSTLVAGAAVLSVSVGAMLPTAASAQIGGVVFDPRNYAQNILTAARTLEQINNQIQQLQNQATSLVNEARNLQSLPLTVLDRIVDPTGCGDAFRAGMLFGLSNDMDWASTGRLASLMGSIKIAHQGGQNHALSKAEIDERFFAAFDYRL